MERPLIVGETVYLTDSYINSANMDNYFVIVHFNDGQEKESNSLNVKNGAVVDYCIYNDYPELKNSDFLFKIKIAFFIRKNGYHFFIP